jgi:hypothetical protein
MSDNRAWSIKKTLRYGEALTGSNDLLHIAFGKKHQKSRGRIVGPVRQAAQAKWSNKHGKNDERIVATDHLHPILLTLSTHLGVREAEVWYEERRASWSRRRSRLGRDA